MVKKLTNQPKPINSGSLTHDFSVFDNTILTIIKLEIYLVLKMEKLIRSSCNEKAKPHENQPKEGEIKKYFNLRWKLLLV